MKKFLPLIATVGGAIVSMVGYLSQPQVLAVMSPRAAAIVTAVGIVFGAFGIHASHQQTQAMLSSIGATKP